MKKIILIGAAVLGLAFILCAGLSFAVLASPLRGQIAQAIEQVFDREPAAVRVEPDRDRQDGGVQLHEEGILVARVVADSPADEAGVQRGDILLEVDGEPVNDLADLQAILHIYQSGDEVELLVQRGDAQRRLTATLTEGPAGGAYLGIQPGRPVVENPNEPRMDAPFRAGARIMEVIEGSPASSAGLETGDTILSVDGEALNRDNELAEILSGHEPGDRVTFEIEGADGRTREVTARLGENPDTAGAAWLGIRYQLVMSREMDPMMPDTPIYPYPEREEQMPDKRLPFGNGVPFPPGTASSGAVILEVVENSPAEDAGLKAGQILEAVNDQALQRPEDLSGAIADLEPGDTVTLRVFDPHTGETDEVEVTLGENPDQAGAAWLGIQYNFLKLDFELGPIPEE